MENDMDIYSFDEIKYRGDCVAFMTERLHESPTSKTKEWTRFNCPWRPGSDSGAFAVRKKGWHDHVENQGGTIIDLCARAMYGGDMWKAQSDLGKWLGLQPHQKARKAGKARKIKALYDYTDIDGKLVFQVVRYEPKDFRQRRPNPEKEGEWIYNLEGITLVPYRLPEWTGGSAAWVCLVEGEKDADTLAAMGFPATTLPMGAGKWRPEYAAWFRGMAVILWPDADAPGQAGGDRIAWELRDTAASLHRVSTPTGYKDVTEWVESGANEEAIKALFASAQRIELKAIEPPKDAVSEAKQANATPFRNFRWETEVQGNGREKEVRRPRHINDMREDLFKRFWGFPRRVGYDLFDHDRTTGAIRYIDRPSDLLAWITEKSGHPVEWSKFEGCCTQDQFFSSVFHNATRYESVSGVPSWPPRDDVYYTHGDLPPPSPDARWFDGLIGHFNPTTAADRILIKAMFATPLYHKRGQHKPLFVIDSIDGKGVGKSTLINMLSALYGDADPSLSSPFTINHREIGETQLVDRIMRRIMSKEGRRKRIFCIDNVEGFFNCAFLASLVTMPVISGMAPYGRTEERRPNDLTYAITSNSATLGADLINRAIMIDIRRPDVLGGDVRAWSEKVYDYIRKHRLKIIADIKHIIERGPQFNFVPHSRFAAWEADVLAPVCGSMETLDAIWKANHERGKTADGDSDEAEAIREYFNKEIRAMGFDPSKQALWLRSIVLKNWATEAIPGFGGRDGRGAIHALRNLAKDGALPELSAFPDIYPHHGTEKTRGMMWRYDLAKDPDWEGRVYIVSMDGDRPLAKQEN